MDIESYPQIGADVGTNGSDNVCRSMERSDRLRQDWSTTPKPERFDSAASGFVEAMEAHRRALDAGQDGYLDPVTGLFVMTASYLAGRGWCCDRGCRHCPFE